MRRRSFLGVLSAAAVAASQTKEAVLNRPKVPGTLNLRARRRSNKVSEGTLRWDVAQTAIIICDMWNAHTCSLSAQRVAAMAPRMNQVISTARSLGVMIVHSPSDTMKFYEGTPQRLLAKSAPQTQLFSRTRHQRVYARLGRAMAHKRPAADPGSSGHVLWRSRVCSASLRAALRPGKAVCCVAPGKRREVLRYARERFTRR